MQKLTKRKTLGICRDLWEELERTGDECKADVIHHTLRLPPLENCCPCCEYAFALKTDEEEEEDESDNFSEDSACKQYCPLYSKWVKDTKILDPDYFMCEQPDSPYKNWRKTNIPERRIKYARIIKDLAIEALIELEQEEKDDENRQEKGE